jgi:hypothetical protein
MVALVSTVIRQRSSFISFRSNFLKNSFAHLLIYPIDSLIFAARKRGKAGAVAQSVEQRTENPCVAGSIPAHTTKKPSVIF